MIDNKGKLSILRELYYRILVETRQSFYPSDKMFCYHGAFRGDRGDLARYLFQDKFLMNTLLFSFSMRL